MLKRIAIISDHASPLSNLGGIDSGGQNVYVAQVALHLAAKGYLVDIFTRKEEESQKEVVDWQANIRVIHVAAGPVKKIAKEHLLNYMEEFSHFVIKFCCFQKGLYTLVHANFWLSGIIAMDLKKSLGIPFVITFHALGLVRRRFQGSDDQFPDERFPIEDRIIETADRIIAECPQDRQDLMELYHASPDKICMIPCGFDSSQLWPVRKAIACQYIGIDPSYRIVLQLGRMVPRKGVDIAIRGFAHYLRKTREKALMLIVGGESMAGDLFQNPEIKRLKDIADHEGVSHALIFFGKKPQNQLRYFYGAADLFISTPWYEPFGITPVEAMACGTPVIGAKVGGIQYTVQHGVTGFHVPSFDHKALGDQIIRAFSNEPQLHRMSKNAIERVHRFFTWEKVADDLSQLYENIDLNRQEHQVQRISFPSSL